jgi:hypothetical protein
MITRIDQEVVTEKKHPTITTTIKEVMRKTTEEEEMMKFVTITAIKDKAVHEVDFRIKAIITKEVEMFTKVAQELTEEAMTIIIDTRMIMCMLQE